MIELNKQNDNSKQQQQDQQHHSFNKKVGIEFISGSLSGAITRFFVAPLDVVKIRFQLQRSNGIGSGSGNGNNMIQQKQLYTGVLQALSRVVKEEGFRALWKGNLSAELLWISYAAVQFSSYNQILALLDKDYKNDNKPSSINTMIAGATAGILSTAVSYPFDIIRTNIVNNHQHTSFIKTYHSIIKRGGHSFLFNGINSSFLQIVPQMAFQFTFYETLKYLIVNYSNDKNQALKNPFNQFFCGLLSGAVSKFLVLPFDVVKKRLQVSDKSNYGIVRCMKDLYKNEGGIKSLFKGGVPSIMKAGLAAALSFTFFEQSKQFFLKILS